MSKKKEIFNPNRKKRVCLKCHEKFMSEGIQNRLCDPCKKTSEFDSGMQIPNTYRRNGNIESG